MTIGKKLMLVPVAALVAATHQPISAAELEVVSAVKADNVSAVLRAGADLKLAESTLPDGQTLLMHAARSGNIDVIKALVARGDDVNAAERRDGTSAVVWAATADHAPAVQALLKAGANPDAKSLVTAFPHTPPARTSVKRCCRRAAGRR
jgi:ankyrin repeat protein